MDRRSVLKLIAAVPFIGGALVHRVGYAAPAIDKAKPLVFRRLSKSIDAREWLWYFQAVNSFAWGGFGAERLRIINMSGRIIDEDGTWEVITELEEGEHDCIFGTSDGRWHRFNIWQRKPYHCYHFGEQLDKRP
jgi:hypothetical protein